MVGKNIIKYRKAKGMTQQSLAEALCVTRQAVSQWETGKTEPDIETLNRLSEILEVSVEELIYGEPRHSTQTVTKNVANNGITAGAALAMVISYVHWHSIGWAILHGILGWVYVIYYAIKYAHA